MPAASAPAPTPAAPPSPLARLGLTRADEDAFRAHSRPGRVPARIARVDRGMVTALSAEGPVRARLEPDALAEPPAVGDWAVLAPGDGGPHHVEALLPRRTAFVRAAAGERSAAQAVAANVDLAVVLESLARTPSPRRIERFLTLAWESGASPVVVLTKIDVRHDLREAVAAIERAAVGVPVLPLSAVTGEGMEPFVALLEPGTTAVLIGQSGVGKSTLANRLLGEARLAVGDVRERDGRGRHTTTHRELVLLPDGGILIDTPGVRELGAWHAESGLARTFADVDELAARCRFRDCAHESEPGCAVRAAIRRGELDAARLESYRKLQRELVHRAAREDERLRGELRREHRAFHARLAREQRQRARGRGR